MSSTFSPAVQSLTCLSHIWIVFQWCYCSQIFSFSPLWLLSGCFIEFELLLSEFVISFPDITVLGREMMLDHNTDQAFTSIHRNKRRKQLHQWKSISPIFGRRLQPRSCLLVPSTWLKNITSSISRREVEEESNNQQLKCVPIPFVAMAKSVVAMGRCLFSSCTVTSEILI